MLPSNYFEEKSRVYVGGYNPALFSEPIYFPVLVQKGYFLRL